MPSLDYIIYLIGDGNLAHSLAAHFKNLELKFKWFQSGKTKRYFESSDELDKPSIYLLAVSDSNISNLANQFKHLNRNSLYCHFSASLGFDVFPELLLSRSFILHPMQSFPSKQAISISDCYFTCQSSVYLKQTLSNLFELFRIHTIFIELKNREAYHLLGVFSSNFLISLLSVCERLAALNGLSKNEMMKLINPIVHKTIENVENKSMKDALSGPLKRNELTIIKKHEMFLSNLDPHLLTLYKELNNQLKKLLDEE